jgi:hypothetical protein
MPTILRTLLMAVKNGGALAVKALLKFVSRDRVKFNQRVGQLISKLNELARKSPELAAKLPELSVQFIKRLKNLDTDAWFKLLLVSEIAPVIIDIFDDGETEDGTDSSELDAIADDSLSEEVTAADLARGQFTADILGDAQSLGSSRSHVNADYIKQFKQAAEYGDVLYSVFGSRTNVLQVFDIFSRADRGSIESFLAAADAR